MDRDAGRLLRWSRAAVVGVLGMVAGAVGHVSADGLLPSFATMVLLTLGAVAVSAYFLGRLAGRLKVVALVVGAQTVLHVLLTMLAGHRGDHGGAVAATAGHDTGAAGHAAAQQGQQLADPALADPALSDPALAGGELYRHYLSQTPQGAGNGADAAHLAVPGPIVHLYTDLTSHAPMMLAHLLAAVVLGLWLAAGEQALWTILALTGTVLTAAAARVLHAVHRVRAVLLAAAESPQRRPSDGSAGGEPPPPLSTRHLTDCVVRRGPPAPRLA